MKVKGWELKEFYTSGWPEGYYHDDFEQSEMDRFQDADGNIIAGDDEEFDTDRLGVLCPHDGGSDPDKYLDFAATFRRWRKNRAPDLSSQLKALLAVVKERKYVEAEAWLRERLPEGVTK